jgi:hypothetical protein
VASTSDSDEGTVLAGDPDCLEDVGDPCATRNEVRTAVDGPVPNPTVVVIARIGWAEEITTE